MVLCFTSHHTVVDHFSCNSMQHCVLFDLRGVVERKVSGCFLQHFFFIQVQLNSTAAVSSEYNISVKNTNSDPMVH